MVERTLTTMDGYVRVSRRLGRKGPGYISPKVQREAIGRWGEYKGVRIAEWHVDEDESGGNHNRPGLNRAIDRSVNGDTGGIVSWKIDRFSRFTEGGLRDLRRLEEAGADLAFVVEDIDTSGPMGKLVYTMMLAFAEFFLDNVKAGWRTAKAEASARGVKIARANFGFRHTDDGTLEKVPDDAAQVLAAFEACDRDGIAAGVELLRARVPERTWTTFTVKRLLANRAYLGEVRNGEHPPFVDEALRIVPRRLFERVQRIVEKETPRRAMGAAFPLSGVASCGSCGGPMVGGRGGSDKRRVYRCSKRCEAPTVVSADSLEAHVVAELRAAFQHPGFRVGDEDLDTSAAEAALLEAEHELEAFASDLTARKLLGANYHRHLQERVDAVDRARAELHEALDAAEATRIVVPDELWDDLEPAELAVVLRGGVDTVIVGRGRRPLAERVHVVPKGMDRSPIAGAENPQEGVLKA